MGIFYTPAFGSGVTLAIFHSTGISLLIKDRLQSSATFEGIATKASLIISLDRCSILDDLLILIPLHNVNTFSKVVFWSPKGPLQRCA